jgi:hypothetical protein
MPQSNSISVHNLRRSYIVVSFYRHTYHRIVLNCKPSSCISVLSAVLSLWQQCMRTICRSADGSRRTDEWHSGKSKKGPAGCCFLPPLTNITYIGVCKHLGLATYSTVRHRPSTLLSWLATKPMTIASVFAAPHKQADRQPWQRMQLVLGRAVSSDSDVRRNNNNVAAAYLLALYTCRMKKSKGVWNLQESGWFRNGASQPAALRVSNFCTLRLCSMRLADASSCCLLSSRAAMVAALTVVGRVLLMGIALWRTLAVTSLGRSTRTGPGRPLVAISKASLILRGSSATFLTTFGVSPSYRGGGNLQCTVYS